MDDQTPLHTNQKPLVLFLDGSGVQVLIDAVVAFANQCEAEGDICGVVPTCDELHHRLHELREIDSVWVQEMIKHMGSGKYRNRPQG